MKIVCDKTLENTFKDKKPKTNFSKYNAEDFKLAKALKVVKKPYSKEDLKYDL